MLLPMIFRYYCKASSICPEQRRHELLPSINKISIKGQRKIGADYSSKEFGFIAKRMRGCSPAKSTLQQHETGKMENSKLSLEIMANFTEIRSVII